MVDLSTEEKRIISQCETRTKEILTCIELARQYKVGDFLIGFKRGYDNVYKQITTGYGTFQKWVVVAQDSMGCCYVKAVDSNGKPRGHMSALLSESNGWDGLKFELDPEYVNAIILSQSEDFDPVEKQRRNKSIRKEIIEHNKKCKVDCQDAELLESYMRKEMNVGDTFWISIKKNFVITGKEFIKLKDAPRDEFSHPVFRKLNSITKITVRYSNGEVGSLYPTTLHRTNLYSAQPRTYKELSDSI